MKKIKSEKKEKCKKLSKIKNKTDKKDHFKTLKSVICLNSLKNKIKFNRINFYTTKILNQNNKNFTKIKAYKTTSFFLQLLFQFYLPRLP